MLSPQHLQFPWLRETKKQLSFHQILWLKFFITFIYVNSTWNYRYFSRDSWQMRKVTIIRSHPFCHKNRAPYYVKWRHDSSFGSSNGLLPLCSPVRVSVSEFFGFSRIFQIYQYIYFQPSSLFYIYFISSSHYSNCGVHILKEVTPFCH